MEDGCEKEASHESEEMHRIRLDFCESVVRARGTRDLPEVARLAGMPIPTLRRLESATMWGDGLYLSQLFKLADVLHHTIFIDEACEYTQRTSLGSIIRARVKILFVPAPSK